MKIPASGSNMRNLLVAVLLASGAAAQVPQWVQNPGNGHYYALTPPMTWNLAEQEAQSHGGHLATIRNAAEHAWLVQTFGAGMPEDTRLWIGLSDQGAEGSWLWSSGEPVTYTNWGLWEPDDANGNEDHAALWLVPTSYGGGWHWGDALGTNNYSGLVEVPQVAPMASFSSYGSGCLGPSGLVPALAGVPGELPRPGTTSHVRVTNLPLAVTIPLFVVGFSDTWDPDGYPLPLDLGIIGWTGCTQFVADDILYWEITTSGQADQAIIVPANTPIGFTFHVQALVLYAPTGVALSNAVTGVVGY